MKLQPQNAQEANKTKHQAKQGKRERRTAPAYTLVWSEEVQTLRGISTNEVIELRRKAEWRIALAEAARTDDPAVAKFGRTAQADDVVWSKFQVGKYWFCLEFRPAKIREYVVTLAGPPGDIPPPNEDAMHHGPSVEAGAPPSKDGDGSISELTSRQCARIGKKALALSRFARRALNSSLRRWRTKVQPTLLRTLDLVRQICGTLSYNTNTMRLSLVKTARRFASSIEAGRTSFTRMRERSAHNVRSAARLEPRWVNQGSGIGMLLYSWVSDEPFVDWGADLFGALPVDWAANLFGLSPEDAIR